MGLGVLGWVRLVIWAYRSVQPSLQALRAETMVERFTARMHVSLGPGRRSGSDDEQKIREKFAFCLIALDPDNRLRYPPVSLFFDLC